MESVNSQKRAAQVPRLLAAIEVARALGVSKSLVYLWAERGDLPVVRLGRRTMFVEGDVSAFVQSRRQGRSGK